MEDEFRNPIKEARHGRLKDKKGIVMDMNAMVDMAFLLLTFFMLTTTMVKPKVIELVMPVPDKDEEVKEVQTIKESRALTLLPLPDNKLYWYRGFSEAEPFEAKYGAEGIRKVLLEHKTSITDPIVIIKPHPQSRFENLVDLIDEMNITRIDRYAIDEFNDFEKELLESAGVNL
jgi:biopolymer transport protein ExbD